MLAPYRRVPDNAVLYARGFLMGITAVAPDLWGFVGTRRRSSRRVSPVQGAVRNPLASDAGKSGLGASERGERRASILEDG